MNEMSTIHDFAEAEQCLLAACSAMEYAAQALAEFKRAENNADAAKALSKAALRAKTIEGNAGRADVLFRRIEADYRDGS